MKLVDLGVVVFPENEFIVYHYNIIIMLGKHKYFCEMCRKQCKDENAF